MKQKIITQLSERMNKLTIQRDQYSYDFEKKEIELLEVKVNELVTKMNSKKSIFDGYQKDIDKIEMTIQNVNEIIEE